MKKLLVISIICLFSLQCEKGWLRELLNPSVEGCNISTACNYNPDVNKFDNSCEYASCIDCLGIAHGVATLDSCGTCDAVPSNDCEQDCAGEWGGYKILDCDSICDGANLLDHCNVCNADPENDCVADCAGIWGGSSVLDECDICNGNGACACVDESISCECCCSDGKEQDCFGECGGSAVVDQCDVCGGDNSCLPPDLFSHNQSTLFAYYFVFTAYDYSGESLEANQDWIGLFNGDICVGSKLWSGGPTDVPAYGNDGEDYSTGYLIEGDMPTFKIYDASENVYHDAVVNENIVFKHLAVNNILRIDVYVDCLGDIGGTAVIDICGICGGDGDCEGVDCTDNSSLYCQDLSVLQILIDNSLETINMVMDDNQDGIIEPLELGYQEWFNGRLISLICNDEYFMRNCFLACDIPASIGNLENLTYLDLSHNGLTGEIPPEVGALTNLTYLSLSNNQLTGEIPSEIGQLISLTSLRLNHNGLTGEIPSEIGQLTSLTYLSLSNNQLTGEIPSEIGNLTSLTYLSLYGNQLSGEIPQEVGALINLTYLNLLSNDLAGVIPKIIFSLSNLTNLHLELNNFSGDIPSEIGNLTKIEILTLDRNQLTGSIPLEIYNLTHLTNLSLAGNQLTGEIPSEIGNLVNLVILNLWENKFTGELPSEMINLIKLAYLDLSDNELSGSPFDMFLDFVDLIYLYLHNNQFSGYVPVTVCEKFAYMTIGNNKICPPYPYCFGYAEYQDTSNCP